MSHTPIPNTSVSIKTRDSPFQNINPQSQSFSNNAKFSSEMGYFCCSKHSGKPIEKVCLHSACEQEVLICSECLSEAQNHFTFHRDYIFNFNDLIEICKDRSLTHQDYSLPSEKSFNLIVANIDQRIVKYKTHIRREEEKIDSDFNGLIENIVADINDLRNKLKDNLRMHVDSYIQICNQLREETASYNREATSNFSSTNEYDVFLNSLTTQKNSSCNFKRLIANIRQLLLKSDNGKYMLGENNYLNYAKIDVSNSCRNKTSFSEKAPQKGSNAQSPPRGRLDTSQSLNISGLCNSPSSADEKSANKFHQKLKDLFTEFQRMTSYKPLYRNEGEANLIFRNYLSENRVQYFKFLEGLPCFIALQTHPAINQSSSENNLMASGINDVISNMTNQSLGGNSSIANVQKKALHQSMAASLTNFNTKFGAIGNLSDSLAAQTNWNVRIHDKQKIESLDHLMEVQTTNQEGIVALRVLDNQRVVTASGDKTVRLFKEFKEMHKISFEYHPTCLATLRKDELLLVGLYQSFAVVDLSDFSLIKIVPCDHEASLHSLVGLADGQTIITIGSDPKIICTNIFNPDITHPKTYFLHRESINALELFPNNKFIATGGKDRSIKISKLNFYTNNFRSNAFEKLSVDMSLDDAHSCDITALRACAIQENILISGAQNGEIKIWDAVLGKALRSLRNPSGWVFSIITFERHVLSSFLSENRRQIVDTWKDTPDNMSSPKKLVINPDQKKGGLTSEKTTGLSSSKKLNLSGSKSTELAGTIPIPIITQTLPVEKNKLSKNHQDQMKVLQFLATSFDGSMKLYDASNDSPSLSQKSRNIYDCYPFGGVAAFCSDNKISIITSGNKGDSNLHLWALK